MRRVVIASVLLVAFAAGALAARSAADDRADVGAVLDALHDAASRADGKAYFSLFASDAVFLGTDASERWTIDQFKAYAQERFDTGKGWTYTLKPGTRHMQVESDIAWFDELLDNAKYGVCRGCGVLRKSDGAWRIVQYNLTFTVPNDVATDVVALIQKHETQHP